MRIKYRCIWNWIARGSDRNVDPFEWKWWKKWGKNRTSSKIRRPVVSISTPTYVYLPSGIVFSGCTWVTVIFKSAASLQNLWQIRIRQKSIDKRKLGKKIWKTVYLVFVLWFSVINCLDWFQSIERLNQMRRKNPNWKPATKIRRRDVNLVAATRASQKMRFMLRTKWWCDFTVNVCFLNMNRN